MALSDGIASVGQVERAQAAARERRALLERSIADERARTSEVREFADEAGNVWRYTVIDEVDVRIEGCGPQVPDLEVPAVIEGKSVSALAADGLANLEAVKSIVLPPSMVSVGLCAFRGCSRLERIAFPAELDIFDSDWLRGCFALEEVQLPGSLEKLGPSVFDIAGLKRLKLGIGTREVLPGAFLKSQLESIEVAAANPWLRTDGYALYSADGHVLVALAVPTEEYAVTEGCVELAKKSLSSFAELAVLEVPASLEVIADYACTKTAIRMFTAPASLKAIGERAFFACAQLEKVSLNSGLLAIGENAFTDTAIRELFIPATVEEMGFPIAAHTALTYSGPDATLRFSPDATTLMKDEAGGIYRIESDGLHLIRMLESMAEAYVVHPDCVVIEEGSFLKHENLRTVVLPEGLRRIGRRAFRDSKMLAEVNLPDSLEEVEEEAFLGCGLAALHIPAGLQKVGSLAFVSNGAYHGSVAPSIAQISVAESNPQFRMENGLLLERLNEGNDSVLLAPANIVDVIVPPSVKRIAPYAFSGIRTLRSLTLSDRITMVETRGLAFDSSLSHVHIDLVEPIEGHDAIDLDIPDTTRATQQMMLAFGTPAFVNVGEILNNYDNSILNANGFDAATEQRLEPYEQVRRILARMRDPLLMTPANRGLVTRVMEGHFKEFCLAIARHDDRESMEAMLDMGFINAANIDEAIDHVAPVQDASITNFLLEAKQCRFGQGFVDFDTDFAL